MRADAVYLQTMFDELDASHGSVLQYLSKEVGMSGAAIERLHFNLLD